jgi:hypothetical protein
MLEIMIGVFVGILISSLPIMKKAGTHLISTVQKAALEYTSHK